MRHVFPTSEIAHKWAHQTQADARNPQGNLYFRGATLYSYRDSYPIAKLFKKKNAVLVLHVSDTYGNTTSGHCSDARGASSHLPSITVPDVEPDQYHGAQHEKHAQNIKFLVDLAADELAKAKRALSPITYRRGIAQEALTDAETYSRFFGIRRKVPAFPVAEWDAAAARVESINNPDPVRDAKRFKLREQRTAAGAAIAEYREEMGRSMVAAGHWVTSYMLGGKRWTSVLTRYTGRTGTPWYHDMARRTGWRLGEHTAPDRNNAVMLRVNGEQIETSQGARIPLAAAPMVWALVERCRLAGGREFDKGMANGRYKVGDYAIDAIGADGTLKAGCHVIPHSELRSMARQLGI